MNEQEPLIIEVSEEDIAEYVYNQLIEYQYVPTSDEVLDIAKIVFDILLILSTPIEGEE
jgi:hypothetical protein